MEQYIEVHGGSPLRGSVAVQGAKNSALPILAASVLTGGVTVLENCPQLRDVEATKAILEEIGCSVGGQNGILTVDSSGLFGYHISVEHMSALRASIVFLGALLARCGRAELSLPGGCALGTRPIDIHLWALQKLGAQIDCSGGRLTACVPRGVGCELVLPVPSVGATENILLFATSCAGVTTVVNAAREPEIVDLQAFLCRAGYEVTGAGTPVIRVRGGRHPLRMVRHRILPDRIAAATWLCGAAAAGGDVTVTRVIPSHLEPLTSLLREMQCDVHVSGDAVRVRRDGPLEAIGRPVRTMPYPGFPTDMQPLLAVPAALARGNTLFEETVFPDRFCHAAELVRMGAKIDVSGRFAVFHGVETLHGADVRATDLRCGAALVLAAAAAQGTTRIACPAYIDRGYESVENVLTSLGAQLRRCGSTEKYRSH